MKISLTISPDIKRIVWISRAAIYKAVMWTCRNSQSCDLDRALVQSSECYGVLGAVLQSHKPD